MNLGEKTTRIAETAIITTIMTLIIIFGYSIVPIIIFFYPVPFIILGVRHKTRYNIYSIVCSSILIGVLTDIFTGILIFLAFGLISIVLTYMINNKYKPQQILICGAMAAIVTILISIAIMGYVTGVSFLSEINATLTESLRIQLDILKEMQLSTYEMSVIKDMLIATVETIIIMIPAIIIISSVFIVYLNYWMSTAILKRLGYKSVEIPRFMHFRLPNNAIMGSLVIIGAALVFRYMKILYYETIFINTIILISFVFFIQGLSVVVFLMNKRKMHKIVKAIIIFLIIINVPLSLIISLIGFLDAGLDFRKLKRVE
ncbi:putative protein yybS [Proteiniborus sp. DW1]|uniref:DUF2232 domain-containing protein n=1 Tax=Proteiniborus sp. DW1 TaxID=1889883 RepID=UPI00092E0764|nr:DUF2232 domain-containing protein [Proteiniborus sp. DW1]SCG84479.1 putative protein yybS [Proteiniborus sp. DW1]